MSATTQNMPPDPIADEFLAYLHAIGYRPVSRPEHGGPRVPCRLRDQCTADPNGWCQLRGDSTGIYAHRDNNYVSTWLPDKIPAELKTGPQWVCWRIEKGKKIPINPRTGQPASVNDPSTWGTYLDAMRRDADRRGFMFTAEDLYVGIDLDHCRDTKTGEIEPSAMEIIRALNSYTEVSPSGTGLHILAKAKLPPEGRKNGKIEMYDRDRYFTMTGQHLDGTPLTIEDRQQQLTDLHTRVFPPRPPCPQVGGNALTGEDRALLDRVRQSQQREKFEKLWRGEISDYRSHSEADQALINILAFWTKDHARIDRLFRASGLMRNKWDERRGHQTYGERTIAKALKDIPQGAQGGQDPQIRTSGPLGPLQAQSRSYKNTSGALERHCLKDVTPEEVSYLWRPYIPLGKLTLIEGDPGLGKSWLTLAIAAAVSRGEGLPGESKRAPETVLLLTAEDGLSDTVRPRFDKLDANLERLHAIDGYVVLDDEGLCKLKEHFADIKPALCIIDPLVSYIGPSIDINKANQVRAYTAKLADLAKKHSCAIVAVRHLTKSAREKAIYRGLGSIDFTAASRSVLHVAISPDDEHTRVVAHAKCNYSLPGRSLTYTLNNGFFAWTGTTHFSAQDLCEPPPDRDARTRLSEAEDFLQQTLASGPVSAKEIFPDAKAQGISERTLKRAKRKLNVHSRKGPEEWLWELSNQGCQGGQEFQPRELGTVARKTWPG